MGNWVASAEKWRSPVFSLLPSRLPGRERRDSPTFSPPPRGQGRPRCSCAPSRGGSLQCHRRRQGTSLPLRMLPKLTPPGCICNEMDRRRNRERSVWNPSLLFVLHLWSLWWLPPKSKPSYRPETIYQTNKHTVKSEASLHFFLPVFFNSVPSCGDKGAFRICATLCYNVAHLGPGFTFLISLDRKFYFQKWHLLHWFFTLSTGTLAQMMAMLWPWAALYGTIGIKRWLTGTTALDKCNLADPASALLAPLWLH